jgi:hypothetical protein
VRTKGAYANKEDCKKCEANIGGRCKTLVETTWIIKNCPFVATEERLQRDRDLLDKAIREGRIKCQKEDSIGSS